MNTERSTPTNGCTLLHIKVEHGRRSVPAPRCKPKNSNADEVFRSHPPVSRLQKPDEWRLWHRRFRRVDRDRGAFSSGAFSSWAYFRTTSQLPESDRDRKPPACAGALPDTAGVRLPTDLDTASS